MNICGLGSVDTTAVEAEVILPYESTVIVAGEYVPDVTPLVPRAKVTAPDVPPPDKPVPAVTAVISPVDVNTCHDDVPPFHTYIL